MTLHYRKNTRKSLLFKKKIGITFDFNNMSNDDLIELEDIVPKVLQKSVFDKEYNPTKTGLMYESVLDVIGEVE